MATVAEEVVCPLPKVELVETDGVPLESNWHRIAINLLIDMTKWIYRDRRDYFVGGNMFVYYSEQQARNRDYRGPDYFFVREVSNEPSRPYWAVWLEGGRYPNMIIELLSATTAHIDRTVKKDLYEKTFRTSEYFCYDPEAHLLEGWRMVNARYESIPSNPTGRLWCKEFALWLGAWKGTYQGDFDTWLRFYDNQGNVVPTFAETAQHQTQIARQQAETAQQQVEAAERRAETAEAELARLKALMAQSSKSGE